MSLGQADVSRTVQNVGRNMLNVGCNMLDKLVMAIFKFVEQSKKWCVSEFEKNYQNPFIGCLDD